MDPVHLPIWHLQIFYKKSWKFEWLKFLKKIVIFATTVSKPKFQNSVKKLRSFGGSTSELVSRLFSFFGLCRLWSSPSATLKTRWFSFFGQRRLWSGPSGTLKPRWFSLFGQCKLQVRSICHYKTWMILILWTTQTMGQVHRHFETYTFFIRNCENLADWSF